MKPSNFLRREQLNARPALGGWLQIAHPASAEIHARLGYDWLCVDLEHGIVELESMAAVFRAISGTRSVPVARVPSNDALWIRRSLDAGARAVIVPMIESADEGRRAVRAAKFPPVGERGFGYCRANAYGADFADYARAANAETAVILQIEHIRAIENLEKIAAVEGVDALFIGPYDLSGSLGVPGELEHSRVRTALARFRSVCSELEMPMGMHLVRPDEAAIRRCLDEGYRLVALGLDVVFLEQSAGRALGWAREAGQVLWVEDRGGGFKGEGRLEAVSNGA